jgi:hypothetical protein
VEADPADSADPDDEHPASPMATATVPIATNVRQDREFIVITGSSEAHRADLGNEVPRPTADRPGPLTSTSPEPRVCHPDRRGHARWRTGVE